MDTWRHWCEGWLAHDLEQTLACFTFVADVTTLASHCRFAGDEEMLVARYDGLPFTAVAFHGDDGSAERSPERSRRRLAKAPARLAALTRQLLAPGEEVWLLVGEEQWPLVQAAYHVLEAHEEWQMIFRGDPAALDPGDAVSLGPPDMPEMAALAGREGMAAFERDPLARGPWYGVRRADANGLALVAQGGTHLMLSHAAEIGNVVTARTHRRRGYGSQVVAALVRALHARGKAVFLQVFKDNEAAIACYERLGFERLRTMHLAKCRP